MFRQPEKEKAYLVSLMAERESRASRTSETKSPHPFYYVNPSHLSWLRRQALDEGTAAGRWVWSALGQAVEYLDRELPKPDWFAQVNRDPLEIQAVSQTCFRWVHHLAFGFLLSGDERMARKALSLMQQVCEWPRWTHSRYSWENWTPERMTNYRAQLPTSTLTKLVATGYDWLYDWLSDRDRIYLRMVLIEKGIEPIYREWIDPERRLHEGAWCNWWAVMSGAGGTAAVILDGDEPTGEWIPGFKRALLEWFNYPGGRSIAWFGYDITSTHATFGRDGGYSEGLSYLNYALQYALYFLYALRDKYGDATWSEIPQLRGVSDFWLHSTFGGSPAQVVNFNDGGSSLPSPEVVAGLAGLLRDPNLQWYLTTHYECVDTPHGLLAFNPRLVPCAPDRNTRTRIYRDLGWALARSGWEQQDVFFAFKSGPVFSHGHYDAGSFILAVGNETLLHDPGTCDYGYPQHKGYFMTTRAHNTVLIDDQGQSGDASLKPVLHTDDYFHVVGNLAPAYRVEGVNEFLRHAVFSPRTGTLVIMDRFDVGGAAVDWLLHPGTQRFEHEGSTLRVDGEHASVKALVVYPEEEVRWTREQGWVGKVPKPADYLRLSVSESGQMFMVVLAPWTHGQAEPCIEATSSGDYCGVLVKREDVYEYWFCRVGSGAGESMLRVELAADIVLTSDAEYVYMCFSDQQETIDTVAVVRAQRYTAPGITVEADHPVDMVITRESDDRFTVTLVTDAPGKVGFRAGAGAAMDLAETSESVSTDTGASGVVLEIGPGETVVVSWRHGRGH